MSPEGAASPGPVLRIVRGEPTPEELAALVAVLTVVTSRAAGGSPADHAPVRTRWNERSRLVRRPLTPGPGAFRAAALPR